MSQKLGMLSQQLHLVIIVILFETIILNLILKNESKDAGQTFALTWNTKTAIKKSVVLSKFNTTKLHDTGNFCADVINFRDELNRWSAEAEAMGIKIDGEMIKTQFKLGLPPSHQHKSIRDIFRRYDDQDWNTFQAKVINDLQGNDILNEVQESLIPTSKMNY